MRAFLAKIAALMRKMGSFTTRVIKVAGRWVSQLVHVPATTDDVGQADAMVDTRPSRADDLEAVRDLAKVMAAGLDVDPAKLRGVPDMTVAWLKALDRRALCAVVTAQDEALAAHLRGRPAIRGVVPYDRAAIAEVAAAKDQPRPRDRQPTLRDMLEERAGLSIAI